MMGVPCDFASKPHFSIRVPHTSGSSSSQHQTREKRARAWSREFNLAQKAIQSEHVGTFPTKKRGTNSEQDGAKPQSACFPSNHSQDCLRCSRSMRPRRGIKDLSRDGSTSAGVGGNETAGPHLISCEKEGHRVDLICLPNTLHPPNMKLQPRRNDLFFGGALVKLHVKLA